MEFRKFLDALDAAVPAELDVHMVMDNYGTHKAPLIKTWLAKRPLFHVHSTPTYGSWLNLVERGFAEITQKSIRRGAFHSVPALKKAIREYIEAHSEAPSPSPGSNPLTKSLRASPALPRGPPSLMPTTLIKRTAVTGH